MTGGLPGDPGQQAHASRSLTSALTAAESDPQGQVPASGCKTGSDPTNLPASQAARHHPIPPAARTDLGVPHHRRGNPRQQPARTRRRFHANATSPDEYGCKTVGPSEPRLPRTDQVARPPSLGHDLGPGQGRAATSGQGRRRAQSVPFHGLSADDRRAISVPLTRVTRGQPGSLRTARSARSAPLPAVTAALPKLIVRVRFSSPAPEGPTRSGRNAQPALGPHAEAGQRSLATLKPCECPGTKSYRGTLTARQGSGSSFIGSRLPRPSTAAMRMATSGATAPKDGGQRAACAACADEGPSRPPFPSLHTYTSGRSGIRGFGPVSSVIWSTVTPSPGQAR